MEIFTLFFTDWLIKHIVECTNEFLVKDRCSFKFIKTEKGQNTKKNYQDLTENEFRVYLGIKMYVNFVGKRGIRGNISIISNIFI